ncbi:Sec-independent protein translocase subunit TatA [Nocardia takedensis]|uniref:Sec-independent protein translocase subunit TatA n=1 Tax=Nocardia takedensis TaxID=259390 RepID=UPI0002F5FCD7|nr:Sec-independent protein translocase subunit TatA [Nocardia takedensis]
MGTLSVTHWLIILGVVVILFGAKRMPDAARGLGRSLRIFKSEVREMHNDDEPQAAAQAPASVPRVAHPEKSAMSPRVVDSTARQHNSAAG